MKKHRILKTILAAALPALALAHPAQAASPARTQEPSWNIEGTDWLSSNRFEVRTRAVGVVPQERSKVNLGGKIKVSNTVTPEIDLSYYFTNHISAELIAATARHTARYGKSVAAQTWILPPTITAQYHFFPGQSFNPYVGAGLNYSIFYRENSKSLPDTDIGNGVGYALQAGTDYWLDKHWGLNLDVKKIFLNVDVNAINSVAKAKVHIDPWLFGAGLAYHF